MEAVYEGRPQKANAQDKEGTALLCVITDQGHGAGNQRQHGRHRFKQGMKLAVALPTAPVEQEPYQKQRQSDETVYPSPFSKLT